MYVTRNRTSQDDFSPLPSKKAESNSLYIVCTDVLCAQYIQISQESNTRGLQLEPSPVASRGMYPGGS